MTPPDPLPKRCSCGATLTTFDPLCRRCREQAQRPRKVGQCARCGTAWPCMCNTSTQAPDRRPLHELINTTTTPRILQQPLHDPELWRP